MSILDKIPVVKNLPKPAQYLSAAVMFLVLGRISLPVVAPVVLPLLIDYSPINLNPGDRVSGALNCPNGFDMDVNPFDYSVECLPLIATSTPVNTSVPATNTAVASTGTRTPTQPASTATKTRTPTPTPLPPTVALPSATPLSGGVPFAGAPLCPTHNDTAWHGLWDFGGCHYDHTHHDDPALGNAVFGPVQYSAGVSYPWLTNNENDIHGHTGYKYYVNISPKDFNGTTNASFESYEYLGTNLNQVTGFRIQYHDAATNAHMVKRFHSYYMEVQINGTGIIRTGGWADFGCLHKSYKESFLPLPGIDPVQANGQTQCGTGGQSIHADPYRGFGDTWQEIQGQTSGDNFGIWTSHNRYGYNQFGYFFFRTLDSFGAQDAADPYADHFICPTFTCKFNNSEHNVFNVFMMIPASMDNLAGFDTNPAVGIITGQAYTNVQGQITGGCLAPNSNCVPLQMVDAPVGTAIWSRNLSGIRPEHDPIREHDIYFNGQPSGWIVP